MSMPADNPYDSPAAVSNLGSYSVSQSRMMKLKRVDPVSCGKMLGALYLVLGLIAAAVMVVIVLIGVVGGGGGGNNAVAGIASGLLMAVFVPVFYGVLGFIGGLIMALIYNLVASFVGGVEMEFGE